MLLNKRVFLTLILSVLLIQAGSAEDLFRISGRISFKKKGDLTIRLETNYAITDKYSLKKYEIKISNEDLKLGYKDFVLPNVPKGIYSIIVLQDVNGNGIFDMGKFGPKEPWGNYQYARPRFRAATFEEMAFDLNGHLENIEIFIK